ncbi:MAG: YggS family pyridoxal phosphate-dependent enzyme [Faecalibacillus sp.]
MIVNEDAVNNILKEVGSGHLVAATKYVDEKEIEKLEKLGVHYFGENRVQAFLEKYEKYHGKGHWHFIGTLQCNKVKYIIDKVELIHSINTLKLIKEVEKQASKINKTMDILLEVNIADEESKQGFDKSDLKEAMNLIKNCTHINVKGLMMMAPNIEPEETRVHFRNTKKLLEELKNEYPEYTLDTLSMGMSQDYQIALEEGSTFVRIGRALFQ